MDVARFAHLLRVLTQTPTRRDALRALGLLGVGGLLGPGGTQARRKKKKKGRKRTPPATVSPPPPPFAPLACGLRTTTLTATRRFAQTFKANGSGSIGSADVEVTCVPAGTDFTIEIRSVGQDGVPTAQVLATADVIDVPLTPAPNTRVLTVAFSPPAPVVHGTTYAIVLTDQASSGYCAALRQPDGCAGQLFTDATLSGTFTPKPTQDLVFAVRP